MYIFDTVSISNFLIIRTKRAGKSNIELPTWCLMEGKKRLKLQEKGKQKQEEEEEDDSSSDNASSVESGLVS